jgi:hypothetical protein
MMFSNNPIAEPVCFDCIKKELNPKNLSQADFFCRTYNLPFKPEIWINLESQFGCEVFREYARLCLDDQSQPNLSYTSSTKDLWNLANKEWEKCRTQAQLINRIEPIKEAYVERAAIKWGGNYSYEDYIKLDSTYNATLRANNITNPLQKEAVKMLCKIHIELNQAILAGDTKAVKDYTSAYSNFAKQAGLEDMIEESKTDDITTVAELYDYMERKGFQFKFYDNFDRDEVDKTLRDIKESNRRLVLESTGLGALLEDMAKKRAQQEEENYTEEVTSKVTLQQLLDFNPEETEVEKEDDSLITGENFDDEDND